MIDNFKAIVLCEVQHDQVDGGGFDGLEEQSKLINNNSVVSMWSTEEQHHQKNRREDALAASQFETEAVKPGTILKDGLRVALDIIEEGEERSEGI